MVKKILKTKYCPDCGSNIEAVNASTFGSAYYRCSKGCGYEKSKGKVQSKK